MRQFVGYPIFVNYNRHTQLRSQFAGTQLHTQGQYQQEKQLYIKNSTTSDSRIENNLYKQEVDQWEQTVYGFLQDIVANPVGRMVLGLINKQTKVWIVPMVDPAGMKSCSCAQTNPLDYVIQPGGSVARGVGYGDTVIQFRPELGDDTLFHELVHSYRYSYKKYNPIDVDIRRGSDSSTQSSEELFAHQIESIYLSQSSRPVMMDYEWDKAADKDTIYAYLLENVEMLMAMKYFLRHEYLAMLAAHNFSADYNPFRDFPTLESQYLRSSSISDSKALPELGAM